MRGLIPGHRMKPADALKFRMNEATGRKWWGEFELAEDERRWWTLGPLLLGAERRRNEWRIGYEEFSNGDAAVPETNRTVDELKQSARFVFADPGAAVRLTPALADRPVVTRPMSPVSVPPGESALLFVSSPAWVRVESVGPGVELADAPVARPSDTWFGASTRYGEICYATRTSGRLRLEDLPPQPFRVITPLEIVNEASMMLNLERLSLPVPYLTIYWSESQGLWTQKVKMRCEDEAELVTLRIRQRPPSQVSGAEQVAEPRKTQDTRVITRALSSLFG